MIIVTGLTSLSSSLLTLSVVNRLDNIKLTDHAGPGQWRTDAGNYICEPGQDNFSSLVCCNASQLSEKLICILLLIMSAGRMSPTYNDHTMMNECKQ